ncbi:MAG TPA: hypothetical protein DDX71_03255 [Ruminococcus sp.]|nr:hypothetical protein [Ruminococcus sp.]
MERWEITLPDCAGIPRQFAVCENDTGITLLKCLDNQTEQFRIPAEIGGRPVTVIGEGCFMDLRKLTEVIFPETLREIGVQAFALCKSLRRVILPDSVTEIRACAFRDCRGLEKVRLSPNLRRLRAGVFGFCCLTDPEFEIPEGLEIIEEHAFYDAGYFTLHLPDSVRGIGRGAFHYGPKAVTRLPYDKGWYLDFPYGEMLRFADGTEGTVIGYNDGGYGCLILQAECGGKQIKAFYPCAGGEYTFADEKSQARMNRYAKELTHTEQQYQMFLNGYL